MRSRALVIAAAAAVVITAVVITAGCGAPAVRGHAVSATPDTRTSAAAATTSTSPPRPLTDAQVDALARRDLVLLVDVDYREITRDLVVAEAQMSFEYKRQFLVDASSRRASIVRDHVVETVQAITSVKVDTSDRAYPAATLRFVVRVTTSSSGPTYHEGLFRLTFANQGGQWLVANEESFPP